MSCTKIVDWKDGVFSLFALVKGNSRLSEDTFSEKIYAIFDGLSHVLQYKYPTSNLLEQSRSLLHRRIPILYKKICGTEVNPIPILARSRIFRAMVQDPKIDSSHPYWNYYNAIACRKLHSLVEGEALPVVASWLTKTVLSTIRNEDCRWIFISLKWNHPKIHNHVNQERGRIGRAALASFTKPDCLQLIDLLEEKEVEKIRARVLPIWSEYHKLFQWLRDHGESPRILKQSLKTGYHYALYKLKDETAPSSNRRVSALFFALFLFSLYLLVPPKIYTRSS